MTTDTLPRVHPLLLSACAHPREWDRILVLADAVDEAGDAVEALGWRLLAGARRWPFYTDSMSLSWWVNGARMLTGSVESDLPGDIYDRLEDGRRGDIFEDYEGDGANRVALTDAARAYGRAWLAGWRPGEGVR